MGGNRALSLLPGLGLEGRALGRPLPAWGLWEEGGGSCGPRSAVPPPALRPGCVCTGESQCVHVCSVCASMYMSVRVLCTCLQMCLCAYVCRCVYLCLHKNVSVCAHLCLYLFVCAGVFECPSPCLSGPVSLCLVGACLCEGVCQSTHLSPWARVWVKGAWLALKQLPVLKALWLGGPWSGQLMWASVEGWEGQS